MIKADGRLFAFFERPIAGGLGALALAVLCFPLIRRASVNPAGPLSS